MANKISVYSLGHSGVVIDKNPLEPSLPDDALRTSQNAVHDPTLEHGGALVKRQGFKQFNLLNAGGPILGGIPMAVAGTGGAPAGGGGGMTGGGTGGGSGTGGPGETGGTGGGPPSYPPPGSGTFGGGSLFGGARLIVIGRTDNTENNSGGTGWYITSKGLADAAIAATSPGPPGGVYSYPPGIGETGMPYGFPSVVNTNNGNWLYYAAAHYQPTPTVQPTIRKTNGAEDLLVATIPRELATPNGYSTLASIDGTSGGTQRSSIITMFLGPDKVIYVGVKDKWSGQTTSSFCGRVFKLYPESGALVQIAGTPPIYPMLSIPFTLGYFINRPWWCSFNDVTDTGATINMFDVEQKHWLVDKTLPNEYANVTCGLAATPNNNPEFNGRLWFGVGVKSASPIFARLYSRGQTAGPGDANAWFAHPLASGGAAQNHNYYPSMAVFGDALYASYYNHTQTAKIYKITADNPGDHESTSFTFSTVFTNSGVTDLVPYWLYVDDGVLYAYGSLGVGSGSNHHAMVTTDGTNWTDRTANIGVFANASYPIPIFFGLDQ
jgi:hypothetical protein